MRHLWHKEIAAAWSHPETARAFSHDRRYLIDAFTKAQRQATPQTAAALVAEAGNAVDAFKFEIDFTAGMIYERPGDIFGRAWLELFDYLTKEKQLPKTCEFCGNPYTPTRSDQRYCPDTACQRSAYERRRRKEPWRREYDRMRKQRDRNRISDEEYEEWKRTNPRPVKGAK